MPDAVKNLEKARTAPRREVPRLNPKDPMSQHYRFDEPTSKVIRRHCLHCCNGSAAEVELCTVADHCPLWPWRFGMKPRKAHAQGKQVGLR